MAAVDDIVAALQQPQQRPAVPPMGAMAAIQAARDQLATQPARLERQQPTSYGTPEADAAAMSPETFVPPGLADWTRQAAPKDYGVIRDAARGMGSIATIPQRALEASENLRQGGEYDPGPILEAATLPMGTGAIAGLPMRAGEVALGAGPIRAYHGSPHDFDAFSMDKIGTGEGAQAYGHGLYFAENEGVAKGYRDTLAPSRGKLPDDIISLPPEMRQAVQTHAGTDVDALTAAKRAQYMSSALRETPLPQVQDMIERTRAAKAGRMYEVNINADPEHFLDWDKPLSEQSPATQQAIRPLLDRYHADVSKTYGNTANDADWGDLAGAAAPQRSEFDQRTGQQINTMLGHMGQTNTAAALREAGIPGIKYLDQGSRAPQWQVQPVKVGYGSSATGPWATKQAGNPNVKYFDSENEARQFITSENDKNATRNYVVFNDKLIDIARKYGMGSIAALPPAALAAMAPNTDQTQ